MGVSETPIATFPLKRECPYDPPSALRQLQAEDSISRVRIWDGSTPWLITRYGDVRAILADPRFSADPHRPGYPAVSAARKARTDHQRPSIVLMDDPEHARLRSMLIGEFSVRRIEALRPMIAQTVDKLLDAMAAGDNPTDLVQAFALPLPSLVISQLLGVPYRDHDFFQNQSHVIVDNTADEDQVLTAVDALQEYMDQLVENRLRDPADDLVSRLAARVNAGELEPSEAAALAWVLLIGGHDTTANMVALGALALLRHPDAAVAVREGDEATVRSSVEELFRVLTVNQLGRRRVATEDVAINGFMIRAGEGVILAANQANRDPHKYMRPDELDITRGTNQHLAFGFGVHQCLGQPLARLELQIAYPALLRRFPNLRVTVPDSDLQFREEMNVYGVHELPVMF